MWVLGATRVQKPWQYPSVLFALGCKAATMEESDSTGRPSFGLRDCGNCQVSLCLAAVVQHVCDTVSPLPCSSGSITSVGLYGHDRHTCTEETSESSSDNSLIKASTYCELRAHIAGSCQ
jgi:hypothetical protein